MFAAYLLQCLTSGYAQSGEHGKGGPHESQLAVSVSGLWLNRLYREAFE